MGMEFATQHRCIAYVMTIITVPIAMRFVHVTRHAMDMVIAMMTAHVCANLIITLLIANSIAKVR
jgi:hypothetical protein